MAPTWSAAGPGTSDGAATPLPVRTRLTVTATDGAGQHAPRSSVPYTVRAAYLPDARGARRPRGVDRLRGDRHVRADAADGHGSRTRSTRTQTFTVRVVEPGRDAATRSTGVRRRGGNRGFDVRYVVGGQGRDPTRSVAGHLPHPDAARPVRRLAMTVGSAVRVGTAVRAPCTDRVEVGSVANPSQDRRRRRSWLQGPRPGADRVRPLRSRTDERGQHRGRPRSCAVCRVGSAGPAGQLLAERLQRLVGGERTAVGLAALTVLGVARSRWSRTWPRWPRPRPWRPRPAA